MSGFAHAFKNVKELVASFKQNESHYLAAKYQESEARKDFIDKFWIALGWDVNHDAQRNPYEQEVKVERGVSVGAARKRADYAFYVAPNFREGDVKFFVEAKKPSGELVNSDNCFQLVRYGWSSQTSISVLFSFYQFVIIDCRYKPDIDTSTQRVLEKYSYAEYANEEVFAKIYWLFSREALAQNAVDKYAETLTKKRGATQRGLFKGGYQSIDEAFLEELDEYRDVLARLFKNNNSDLDGDTLTELTQRTLDRLVFMRFLEDKLIEPEPMVSKFGDKGGVWGDFVAASKRLDRIYNGIVFKRNNLLDASNFKVNDDQFGEICERLSHINSPYDFNAIPIHILGSIYERFLGKVIVATDKRARVEEKPEVRKAGGVYYTPEYIVRYIVENTVGKLIEGKTPAQIAELRFADIACGSGSFLLGVFDLLLRYHTSYFTENPGKAKKGETVMREDGLHLSLAMKRAILVNNIYGVDIDNQAVEVAQLSLFLKLLQDETPASARGYQLEIGETLLPTLSKNIVCGNSLIGTDILTGQLFATDEERKLNPMDYEQRFPEIMKRGGFDAIVGNPPYVDSEWMTQTSPLERSYCSSKFKSASGNWDLFCVFIEQASILTKPKGFVSLIVPNKLASAKYASKSREVITTDNSLISIRDYSNIKVFPVSVYPIVFIAQISKANNSSKVLLEKMKYEGKNVVTATTARLEHLKYFSDPSIPWSIFSSRNTTNLVKKIFENCEKLGNEKIASTDLLASVRSLRSMKSLKQHDCIFFSCGDFLNRDM